MKTITANIFAIQIQDDSEIIALTKIGVRSSNANPEFKVRPQDVAATIFQQKKINQLLIKPITNEKSRSK